MADGTDESLVRSHEPLTARREIAMEKVKLTDAVAVVWTVAPHLTDRQINIRLNKMTALKEQIDALKAELAPLEKAYDALESEVIDGIGAKETTISGSTNAYTYERKVTPRKTIDTTKLRKERPDIASEYEKVSMKHDHLKFDHI